MKKRVLLGVLFAVAIMFMCYAVSFADSILSPKRTTGQVLNPAVNTSPVLVTLTGPGKFLGAQIHKVGGSSDMTNFYLDIDGVNVIATSIYGARNLGLTSYNPHGIIFYQSATGNKVLILGFNSPLVYQSQLKLRMVVQETGVSGIYAEVIHGK